MKSTVCQNDSKVPTNREGRPDDSGRPSLGYVHALGLTALGNLAFITLRRDGPDNHNNDSIDSQFQTESEM